MSTRRCSPARIAAAAAVLVSWAGAAHSAGVAPVRIEVRSRAVAPGEPLRIEVDAPAPLAELRGSFLGTPVTLVRRGTDGGRESWSGWSMVGLDVPAGVVSVEISGRTAAGQAVLGSHALTVETRDFPLERIEVEPRYVEPPPAAQRRLERERRRLADVYALRTPAASSGEAFSRPLPGEATSAFGTRRVFNGKPRSPHSGLDLQAATGTPVRASGPGRVVLAQDLYYSGLTVIVDHGAGLFTLYAHLSEFDVAEGGTVRTGQQLGRAGATGRVTGPHLHWGAKIGDRPFDPTALLDPRLFGAGPQTGRKTGG